MFAQNREAEQIVALPVVQVFGSFPAILDTAEIVDFSAYFFGPVAVALNAKRKSGIGLFGVVRSWHACIIWPSVTRLVSSRYYERYY
jgi:hypothetical protein